MAAIGRAFGMRPIAWSPNLTLERGAAADVAFADRETFFAEADVLTIHLVLGDRTHGLVGGDELARMRASAILVNTSRGPIVDEAALIAALRAGRIRAAGLDVFDREPLPVDHPLLGLENVVLTPHLGYVTEGTYRVFFSDTVQAIAAWQAGRAGGGLG